MLRTDDLDYHLPEGAIATSPADPRESARLLVVTGEGVSHRVVGDLPELLGPGDLLILNTTRVLPARLVGVRVDTGAKAEGLYLRELPGPGRRWAAMIRSRRLKEGMRIAVHPPEDAPLPAGAIGTGLELELVRRLEDEPGAWEVIVHGGEGPTPDLLARVGRTPLPPYILAARRHAGLAVPDAADRERYQTLFAQGPAGSVAAPTAGLHLTPALLDRLHGRGVASAHVVLHVGTGTFKPVESEWVEQHPMHEEPCTMPEQTAQAIERTRRAGGRVICVGTTACRTVETFGALAERGQPPSGWVDTRLLITPGYRWRWCDGLLTNFHLPRSTLMALVGARLPGGVEQLKGLYAQALDRGYRFYSYGDAMLVL